MANFRSLIRMKSINQTTTITNEDIDLSFIDGLRFWSNVWIIIAHTFVYEDWNSYSKFVFRISLNDDNYGVFSA